MSERALWLIKKQTNSTVGGYENMVEDGCLESMPTRKELEDEIYQDVINAADINITKDIRFEGTKRIKEMISKQLDGMN